MFSENKWDINLLNENLPNFMLKKLLLKIRNGIIPKLYPGDSIFNLFN